MQKLRSDNELHNLFTGDYLYCQGCGHIIYAAPLQPFTFKFITITRAYVKHLRKCHKIREILIRREQERRGLVPDYQEPEYEHQDHEHIMMDESLPETHEQELPES